MIGSLKLIIEAKLASSGDLAGALAAYRESLEVIRRLAQADLSHAGWQAGPEF